jgi:predicted LPLAT superfamily acyltransferase
MSARIDGKWTYGPRLGIWIFMQIIRFAGPFPAYPLLFMVTLYYTLKDKKASSSLNSYYKALGIPFTFAVRYKHFVNFGMSIIDRLAFLAGPQPRFTWDCVGEDLFEKALAKGKGLILLSAHTGNWEIAGNLLNARISVPVNLVMVQNEQEAIQKVFSRATSSRKVNIIPLSDGGLSTMIAIREALRRNEIVCFMGDRLRAGEDFRMVPFLGTPAKFPVGAFSIAVATNAPMCTVFAFKKGLRTYHYRAFDLAVLADVPRPDRQKRIMEALTFYVTLLEKRIKEFPDQWYNFFDFWE